MNLLVILGHPRIDSLCGALAAAYATGAKSAGCTVQTLELGEMTFNPDVEIPSPTDQPLEPDLERARDLIIWADHLVFVFPNWWGMMPARLKGFLDRVLYPGFAFREDGGHYYGLLAPRTAELLITMDVPPPIYRWVQGAPGQRAMTRATLGLCGIKTLGVHHFSPPGHSEAPTRAAWVTQARALGERLTEGPRRPVRRRLHLLGQWLLAVRPQFFPMSVLAYTLGALLLLQPLNALAFGAGLVAMVALKAATVLTNDIFDRESDAANRNWGPFNGGGRSLHEGVLSLRDLWHGVWVALTVCALAALVLLFAVPNPGAVALVLGGLMILALGYTLPPIKLSHRGLGELDVALTHGPGVLLLGFVAQGGDLLAIDAWATGLTIGLAVLPAIMLANIPDITADAAAGKTTLAVRLGAARVTRLAQGLTGLSALAALTLAVFVPAVGLLLPLIAVPYAALQVWMLERYRRKGAPVGRIDLLLVMALSYVALFVLLPLIGVW
ncbi:NAD(P)H-dependent oxidoreductase [Roseinatronobacter sp. S2]|uniref:NAD(P)H-dependent oxidoreductase n=1 Tax=Roseinatronobacter sp. S2 TaxID=3035471 RepID=UPI0024106896|nr:NAD(P)H-dependent oxidoreductase [Roseinatronobacter sp. S2]WFE76556.1 NAD(P)H-dependent oxidoreductase [Roseinatronobacter sp. S2]